MSKKMFLAVAALMMGCMAKANEVKDTLTLTLDRAIEIAIDDNPTIKIADREIALKKVANKETWQHLLPEASISAGLDHTIKAPVMKLSDMEFKMGKDGTNTVNGALTVSLPVFAPTVYRAMKMTKTDIALSVEKARESRQELINQVTKAYYQLLLSQDSYEVMKKSYALSEENLNVVSAKYSQGKVSEYDKLSAEVQLGSIRPSMVSAANAVRLSGLQLKVLMGIDENYVIKIDDRLASHESEIFAAEMDSRNDNLSNNTTMKQLNLNMDLLEKNIKTQRMNFIPTLGLRFNYQYQSLYNENLKLSDYNWSNGASLMLSLNIPLYRAGNHTKMKTAKLQLDKLRWNRTDVERKLNMQIENYRNNMSASLEQVNSNRENVKQAEKAMMIAGKRYEVGHGTILELNSSQVALTQSQLIYNQSIFDFLIAKADLDKVLGRE